MLHSENIPSVPSNIGRSEMLDLFRNFTFNWDTLTPYLVLVLGVFFFSFIGLRIKNSLVD